MSLSNPLSAIWEAYSASLDALKIARKVAVNQHPAKDPKCQQEVFFYQQSLLSRTMFPSVSDVDNLLVNAKRESSDLVMLGLWATFERFLRQCLQEKGEALKHYVQPAALGEQLYEHYYREVEYWSPEDLLNLLKMSLFTTPEQSHQLGIVKQIYEYRNWVAHGKNPQKPPHAQITPKPTYDTLTEVVECLLKG